MHNIRRSDPRSVARDIPGMFEAIFPQLTPGVVGVLNRSATSYGFDPVPNELIDTSKLQKAMLFEIAYSVAESLIQQRTVDWGNSLNVALERQRRHFDAVLPDAITNQDKEVALAVAKNLSQMMSKISLEIGLPIKLQPFIPGYQWIESGNGDFSVGSTLIEAKCTGKNFSAADYRQILMYWLLSFAKSLEHDGLEWKTGILLNPRSASVVTIDFSDLISTVSAGRSKIEVMQLFETMMETSGGI